jgi:exodeoxyribonuclease VII large subunit
MAQEIYRRLHTEMRGQLESAQAVLAHSAAQLKQLHPLHVLERGYSMVEKADGQIVRDSNHITIDENLKITFAKGHAEVAVRRKE